MNNKSFVSNIIRTVIMLSFVFLTCCSLCIPTVARIDESEPVITSEPVEAIIEQTRQEDVLEQTVSSDAIPNVFIDIDDTDALKALMDYYVDCRNAAHAMAEEIRAAGGAEDNPVIKQAQIDYATYTELYHHYEGILNEQCKLKEEELLANIDTEYGAAEYVHWYFISRGFSEEITAGLIGNMMAEVGGGTLHLYYTAATPYFYGICQWMKSYYPEVWGKDLPEQCEYLLNTMEEQFSVFGFCYGKGITYQQFLELDSAKEAALAFAKCYERCAAEHVNIRGRYAENAFAYFNP